MKASDVKKSISQVARPIMAAALLATSTVVPAGQPAGLPKSGTSVIVDNDAVRATRVTIAPGERIHVPELKRAYYHVLQGGTVKAVMDGTGETIMWEPPTEEAAWVDHEGPHSSENMGKDWVTYVTVEVKGATTR